MTVTEMRVGTWTIDEIVDECQRLGCDQLVADLIDLRGRLRAESLNEICGGLIVFLECADPFEGLLHLRELDERLRKYSDHPQMRVSIWSEVLKFESQFQRNAIRNALCERRVATDGMPDHGVLIYWIDAYAQSEWANLNVVEESVVVSPPVHKSPTNKKGKKAMNPNGV